MDLGKYHEFNLVEIGFFLFSVMIALSILILSIVKAYIMIKGV